MTALILSRLPSTPVVEAKPGRLFATTHAALTFAFNHSDQVYDKLMMARMAQAPTDWGKGVGGTDGAGQAAFCSERWNRCRPCIVRFWLRASRLERTDACAARAPWTVTIGWLRFAKYRMRLLAMRCLRIRTLASCATPSWRDTLARM